MSGQFCQDASIFQFPLPALRRAGRGRPSPLPEVWSLAERSSGLGRPVVSARVQTMGHHGAVDDCDDVLVAPPLSCSAKAHRCGGKVARPPAMWSLWDRVVKEAARRRVFKGFPRRPVPISAR
jgi:hypothetical protein